MGSPTVSAAPRYSRRSGSSKNLTTRGIGSELTFCGLGDELFASLCSQELNNLPSPTDSASQGSSPDNSKASHTIIDAANKPSVTTTANISAQRSNSPTNLVINAKDRTVAVTTNIATQQSNSPTNADISLRSQTKDILRKSIASTETLATSCSSTSSSEVKQSSKIAGKANKSIVTGGTDLMFADDKQGTVPLSGSNRTPNAEFSSVYPKSRLNVDTSSTIMSRVQTNVPAFFNSTSGAQTVHVCSEPSAASLKVRGPSYIRTGVKVPSAPSLFALLGVDSYMADKPVTHFCDPSVNKFNFKSRLEEQCQMQGVSSPFLLCVNIVVPWGNVVSYYYRPDTMGAAFPRNMNDASPADRMWQTFLQIMNTKQRSQVFKLIPRVIEGPWMVKKMIGNKPAIVGDKLPVTYHGSVEKGYLEIVMDCTKGNSMVNSIVNACKGAADALTVDLAFVIEGRSDTELPEQVLAAFRIHHINMKRSVSLKTWQNLMEQTQAQSLLP